MKKFLPLCLAIGLVLLCITMVTRSYAFRPATLEAEKKLDAILQLSNNDDNLFEFILKRPWYQPSKDSGYKNLFTPALLRTWASMEAKMVKEHCGGKYREGEICGIAYNPISCSQDPPESYNYRTKTINKTTAVISSRGAASTQETARYILVKIHGQWKLDGIDCGENIKFNVR